MKTCPPCTQECSQGRYCPAIELPITMEEDSLYDMALRWVTTTLAIIGAAAIVVVIAAYGGYWYAKNDVTRLAELDGTKSKTTCGSCRYDKSLKESKK